MDSEDAGFGDTWMEGDDLPSGVVPTRYTDRHGYRLTVKAANTEAAGQWDERQWRPLRAVLSP